MTNTSQHKPICRKHSISMREMSFSMRGYEYEIVKKLEGYRDW